MKKANAANTAMNLTRSTFDTFSPPRGEREARAALPEEDEGEDRQEDHGDQDPRGPPPEERHDRDPEREEEEVHRDAQGLLRDRVHRIRDQDEEDEDEHEADEERRQLERLPHVVRDRLHLRLEKHRLHL